MTPFGPWRPDQADTSDPTILQKAINVAPKVGGYGPVPSLFVLSTAAALSGAPRGAISGVTATGIYKAIFGTATTLELLGADGTWTVLASGLNCTAGDNWSFDVIGKYVVATNTTDGQLAYDLDLGGTFAALSGAPKARVIDNMFGCQFASDCDGSNRVLRNSNFFSTSDWTGGVAGYQEMQTGEELMGAKEVANGVGIVFQRNAIQLARRTADRTLYQLEVLATEQGAVNPRCIVPVRGGAFFVDTDGFYLATPAGVQPIGAGKVDETFLARLAATGLDTVEGAYDPARHRVVWRYQRSDVGSSTIFEDGIFYDLRAGEFAELEETTSAIVTMATPGYSLDAMGTTFGTMDDITTIPLDSRFWFGGEPRLGGLDSSYKFGFFDGPSLAATIEPGTLSLANSSLVTRLRVLSDADGGTVQVGYSDDLGSALTFTTAVAKTRGIHPVRARGRNLRVRYNIPAADAWTFANGIDDIVQASGGAF